MSDKTPLFNILPRFSAALPSGCEMGTDAVMHEVAFRAAEDLIKTWDVGVYMHHTQLKRELADTGGVEFSVTFSKPTPKQPVPPQVANVLVTVEPGSGSTGADSSLRLSYAIEQELYSHDGDEPFRLAWLDSIVLRKQQTQGSVGLFQKKGSVVEPKPFVPGSYFKGMPRPAARKPAAAKPAAGEGGSLVKESEIHVNLSVEENGAVKCGITA